jgi:endoglucanase
VLSPHQYGRRYEAGTVRIIGESELAPAEAFASFWRRFALRFRSTPSVIYGLQNEPHDQDPVALASLSNAAIAAIRAAGCTQLILAPGIGWSGAHSWLTRGNGAAMLAVRDPLNNFAFDAHQYLDADNSGTHAQCSAGAGASRLRAFTDWARRSGRKGFLGEFGAAPGRECLAELDALLSYLSANSDVWLGWTYWAGGPWWGANYPLSIEPQNGGDRPQMTILRRHF